MSRFNNKYNKTVRDYKIKDEAIMRYLKVFYKHMLDTPDKTTVKNILNTRTFNRDNTSLFTLSLQDMLEEDSTHQIFKGNKTATLIIQTLYNYFSEFFKVYWIDTEIGYGCYDQKMGIFTLYMNDDNKGVA